MNGPNITRGLILALSCLVLGFVGGWTIANMGGSTVALPDANLDVTVQKPSPVTGQATNTATTPAVVDVKKTSIMVLNASGVAGRAGQTGTLLTGKGYTAVSVDNAPQVTGNTVYYADGAKGPAAQVGADLQITAFQPLAGSTVESSAKGAKVVVVLGK